MNTIIFQIQIQTQPVNFGQKQCKNFKTFGKHNT